VAQVAIVVERVALVEAVAVLEVDQRELFAVGVGPHRQRRGASAVRPARPAVELHDAGPVAEAVLPGLVGDEHGVDVGAGAVLDPADQLQVGGRGQRHLDHAAGRRVIGGGGADPAGAGA
jgi:hypothetical protein